MAKSDKVWIGDLPPDCDDAIVRNLFVRCTVTSLKFMPPKVAGASAAALIQFGSIEEAEWIVDNINGNIPEGLSTPVVARYADSEPTGGAPWQAKGAAPAPDFFGGKGAGGYGKANGKEAFKGKKGPVAPEEHRAQPYDAGKGKAKSAASNSDIASLKGGLLAYNVLPGGKGPMPPDNQVLVRGLPSGCTVLDLYKIFGPFGAIPARGIKVMTQPDGQCGGEAFVDYVDPGDALKAVHAIISTPQVGGLQITATMKQGATG